MTPREQTAIQALEARVMARFDTVESKVDDVVARVGDLELARKIADAIEIDRKRRSSQAGSILRNAVALALQALGVLFTALVAIGYFH